MDCYSIVVLRKPLTRLDDHHPSHCKLWLTCTIREVTVFRIYLSITMVIKMLNRRKTVNICQGMWRGPHEERRDDEMQLKHHRNPCSALL